MFAVIFGLAGLRKNETFSYHTWTPFESVIYNCLHKTAWSLALGWIVFSCHNGYGGVINDFLSWKAFLPLSKLTFCAYLNHISLQFMIFFSQTSSMYISDFLMSQYFIGILGFTFGIAFVQSLVTEVPYVHLAKILLGGSKGPRPQPPKVEKSVSDKANEMPPMKMNGSAEPIKDEIKTEEKPPQSKEEANAENVEKN